MTVEAEEKSIVAEAASKSLDKIKKFTGFRDSKYEVEDERKRQTGSLDNTKINIDMSAYGIDGNHLEEMLNEKGIFPELVTGNIVMLMTGIGNTRKDFKRLYKALGEIAYTHRGALVKLAHDERLEYEPRQELAAPKDAKEEGAASAGTAGSDANASPEAKSGDSFAKKTAALWSKRRPLHDIPEDRETLPLEQCAGRICASSIIPYPPGIPLICPGEEIGMEEIQYIKYLRQIGDKVIGVSGGGEIIVGK